MFYPCFPPSFVKLKALLDKSSVMFLLCDINLLSCRSFVLFRDLVNSSLIFYVLGGMFFFFTRIGGDVIKTTKIMVNKTHW